MSFDPTYKFNPIKDLDLEIPKDKRKEALEEAAVYLKEALLDYIGSGKSPASGGRWIKGLSKGYKEKKALESSSNFANLENTGEFLDSLSIDVKGNSLEISFGDEFDGRVEAFQTGFYGESSKEKPRQIFPTDGKTFKQEIMSNLKNILKDFED